MSSAGSIGLAQHSTTTRGQHLFIRSDEALQHLLLDVAKLLLAMLLEVASNRAPELGLDLRVAVNKAPVQTPRKLPPDSGLAAARHADQGDAGHGDYCKAEVSPTTGRARTAIYRGTSACG